MAYTLPYPSLQFVPLDVLTAEELNQIVENINSLAGEFPLNNSNIADNAITTSKLINGAVSSGKIDWTSLGFSYNSSSISGLSVSTSGTSLLSLNLSNMPTGATFVVLAQVQANVESSNDSDVTLRLDYGSVHRSITETSSWNTPMIIFERFAKTSSSSQAQLTVYKSSSGVTVSVSQPWMLAFRVG